MDADDSMYTAVVYGKDRVSTLDRAKVEAAQYFDTTVDKIRIISESGETDIVFDSEFNGVAWEEVVKDWNFKINCLCIVDTRPVGIKI